ncbi:hypothetical protein STRDD11_01459 [Streptococcus sp. DD11]|nr:hypothetical protein STRDD11_01459 [Streptococcus sp. DD11]
MSQHALGNRQHKQAARNADWQLPPCLLLASLLMMLIEYPYFLIVLREKKGGGTDSHDG